MELWHNSPATISLLVFNIIATFACFRSKSLLSKMLFIPFDVYHNKSWYRIITSCFIHNDLGHLIFNMIALFSFGIVLEQLVGIVPYLLLYCTCMLLSHIPALLKHKDNPRYRSLGASGAVSGIIYSYILFAPQSIIRIQLFIPLPAVLFGILYLAYCWYAARNIKDGIAHDAHFAGAVSGVIITIILFHDKVFYIWNDLFTYIL